MSQVGCSENYTYIFFRYTDTPTPVSSLLPGALHAACGQVSILIDIHYARIPQCHSSTGVLQFLGVNTVYCVLTTVVSMFTECIFVRWFLDTYLDAC